MEKYIIAATGIALIAFGFGFGTRLLVGPTAPPATMTPPAPSKVPRPVQEIQPPRDPVRVSAPAEAAPGNLASAYAAIRAERPLALLRYLDKPAGLPELRALAGLLAANGDEFDTAATILILARWVELDPRDALAFADEIAHRHGNNLRSDFLSRFFHVWRAMDAPAALAALKEDRSHIGRIILGRITPNEEPDSVRGATAAREALQMGDRRTRRRALSKGISEWAEVDAAAAFDYALGIEGAGDRRMAISIAGHHLAKVDPAHAMGVLLKEPASRWRTSALCETAEAWGKNDPAAFREWFDTLPPDQDRQAAGMAALPEIAKKDLEAALNLLEAVGWRVSAVGDLTNYATYHGGRRGTYNDSFPSASRIASDLLRKIQKSDPKRALEVAGRISISAGSDPIEARSDLLAGIWKSWLGSDPPAAREWLAAMPVPSMQTRLASEFRYSDYKWAGSTPGDALALVARLASTELREKLAGQIVGRERLESARDLAASAEALPREMQEQIRIHILDLTVREDPRFVAAEAASLPEKPRTELFAKSMRYIRDGEGHAEGARFLQEYPEQETAARSYREHARHWMQRDPEAAANWVDSLEAGTAGREQAVGGLILQLSRATADAGADHPLALEWAMSHHDAQIQESSLAAIMKSWKTTDAAAADAALDASAIPEETKARVRQSAGL